MKIIWTSIASKSYYKNIEFLLKIWNLKVAQDFISEVEITMKLIGTNPNVFERWEFDKEYRKGFIHKNVSFFYKVYDSEILVHLFWNNLQNPKELKKILSKSK